MCTYLGAYIGYSVVAVDRTNCSVEPELKSGSARCISCSVDNATGDVHIDYLDNETQFYIILYLSSTGAVINGSGRWEGDDMSDMPVLTGNLNFCEYDFVCRIG